MNRYRVLGAFMVLAFALTARAGGPDPAPIGVCCIGSGQSVVVTRVECLAVGGIYIGAPVDADNPCAFTGGD